LPIAEEALSSTQDAIARVDLLSMLGNLRHNAGAPRAGLRALEEAAAILEDSKDAYVKDAYVHALRASIYTNIAVIHAELGEGVQSRVALAEADEASLRAGDPEIRATVLHNLGNYYLDKGDLESAEAAYAAVLEVPGARPSIRTSVYVNLATIALHRGNHAAVAERIGEVLGGSGPPPRMLRRGHGRPGQPARRLRVTRPGPARGWSAP
jgi:tetratricopeptide (TPR) repeat protein